MAIKPDKNHPERGSEAGRSPVSLRAYNERLVLSLVRYEGLARAEIARRTGLSAQTVSVIIRQLEEDGLLQRGKPIRGKVGQPLVPMSLAPDGAYSFGLKVGRRSADLVLMNLVGEVCGQLSTTYRYPLPDPILEFVSEASRELQKTIKKANRSRIAGLGIAAPFEMWNWADKVGADETEMSVWRDYDLAAQISKRVPWAVSVENDATAACSAELMLGRGRAVSDFLYIFVGTFIGGGVVTDGRLFTGAHGNAGAIGSMPVQINARQRVQLIDVASLYQLEDKLREVGLDPVETLYSSTEWRGFEGLLDAWVKSAAGHIANAVASTSAVIDMPAVIIDGGLPEGTRAELVSAVDAALDRIDCKGLVRPEILAGQVGSNARAVGAACLPLLERFLLDHSAEGQTLQAA